MEIPARLLRAHADDLPGRRPRLTTRELDREDHLLAAGLSLMARFGRSAITIGAFAIAVRLSPTTIRRYFPDLDTLLAEILTRHLRAISRAIGAIPSDAPDRAAACRAAYIATTRRFGAPTERHQLLLRDRHALPPDLAEPIEQLRDMLGEALAGPYGTVALALLDTPELDAAQIEVMLATLIGPVPSVAARPIQLRQPKPKFARPSRIQPSHIPPRRPPPPTPNGWATQPRAGP